MNKKITYRVAQFAVYELDSQSWVLQTTECINIITNIKLVHFLKEIMYRRYIGNNELIQLKKKYGEISDDIIKYLQENEILLPLKELNFNLQHTMLVTNDKKIYDFWDRHYFEQTILLKNLKNINFEDTLLVVILNPYNPEMVRNIYKKVSGNNNFLLLGYFYNFNFYLDNIYHPNLKLPDHFDHIKYVQTKIYSDQTNYTYQDLVDIIFEKDPNFDLIYPISWVDLIMVSHLILERVLTIFDLDKDINLYMTKEILKIEELNMKTHRKMEDFAEFWEMG
ncbi:MAG: McbB family protein [Lactobacillus crispatus]